MIAKLAGLAIDARWALHGLEDLEARAVAARWIAANALAASGVRVHVEGVASRQPRVFALDTPCFAGALAALSALPSLIDVASLPRGWRLALRALGIPALEGAPAVALRRGASVLAVGRGACELAVAQDVDGYRVRIGGMLLA